MKVEVPVGQHQIKRDAVSRDPEANRGGEVAGHHIVDAVAGSLVARGSNKESADELACHLAVAPVELLNTKRDRVVVKDKVVVDANLMMRVDFFLKNKVAVGRVVG